jgi:hypothetical protein
VYPLLFNRSNVSDGQENTLQRGSAFHVGEALSADLYQRLAGEDQIVSLPEPLKSNSSLFSPDCCVGR